jgi:hypothetical protein
MLSFNEVDTESLVDAEMLQLRIATAENKALKEKIDEYQFQIMKERLKLKVDLAA